MMDYNTGYEIRDFNGMFVNGEQTFLDRDDFLYAKLGIEDRVFKTDEGVNIHFHYELDDEGRYYLRIDKVDGLKGKENDKRLQQLEAIIFFWSCETEEFLDHVVGFYDEVF
jgi:hypothetical protein